MNGPSEDLFTSSTFAKKQNRRATAGCLLGQLYGLLHLGALSDNQMIALFDLLREDFDTTLEPLPLESFPHHERDMVRLKGPGDEIVGPFFHRLHRPLHRSVRRYHDHGSIILSLAKFF